MSTSTGRERIGRQLRHQSVDRIGLTEHFWNSTVNRWVAEGHLPEGVSPAEHFDLDLECCWPFLYKIDPGFEDQIVAEDEDTVTLLDGNGATLRRYKGHDTTPEHIGFSVTDRKDWEEKAKPFFTSSRDRIRFDRYREVRTRCAQRQRFFCWEGVGPFEMMHPFCGHENLLLGMGLDPDWVREMAEHLTDMQLALWDTLFAEEGLPDGDLPARHDAETIESNDHEDSGAFCTVPHGTSAYRKHSDGNFQLFVCPACGRRIFIAD